MTVYATENEEPGEIVFVDLDRDIIVIEWPETGVELEYHAKDFMIGGRYEDVYVERGGERR